MPTRHFPKNFIWGVSAAAPQIEGAAALDGKGESIWDRFSRSPGRIPNGDNPDTACDHYRRYKQDIALMRKLGVRHYRLSIAWPRVYPRGDGALNQAGLDHYKRLLDTLHAHGITPWVTMFHWDLPQALEDQGGWRSRRTVDAFARYADTLVRALGPRVRHWMTVNEIDCFTVRAYGPASNKAPGAREDAATVNRTSHHALLCHGHGLRAIREHGARGTIAGFAENPEPAVPLTETPADIAAARADYATANLRVLDPIFRGHYSPRFLRAHARAARPPVERGDFALISAPVDFLGLNIYSGAIVRRGARGRPERLPFPPSYPRTDSPWHNIIPETIYWGPRFATELYGNKIKKIIITENGCGYDDDTLTAAGEILDTHRVSLLRAYLAQLHRAIADGVPVQGYMLWSILDNFEWQDGYARRFGICHVDYATQKRTPKLSAHYYSRIMRANALI
jgi:beta-glucosidase